MISRRQFMQASAAAFALLSAGRRAQAASHSPGLTKFLSQLPGLGPGGIPVATPDAAPGLGGAVHYTIDLRQYTQQLHPELTGATTLWGYGQGGAANHRDLGGLIVANKNQPVQITFRNFLP